MYQLILVLCLSSSGEFSVAPGFAIVKSHSTRPLDWPEGVPWIEGLKEYAPSQYSQRILESNGRDSNLLWHVSQDDNRPPVYVVNPNKGFWQRAGGLPSNCHSRFFVYTPPGKEIVAQTLYVPLPSPAPSRVFPKVHWWHPDGTVLVDQMIGPDGKTFEVRMRKKVNGQWQNFRYTPQPEPDIPHVTENYAATNTGYIELLRIDRIDYKTRKFPRLSRIFGRAPLQITYTDGDVLVPANYVGPGVHCNDCHSHSGSAVYGIGLRGGGDGDFSFSPFVDGTYQRK